MFRRLFFLLLALGMGADLWAASPFCEFALSSLRERRFVQLERHGAFMRTARITTAVPIAKEEQIFFERAGALTQSLETEEERVQKLELSTNYFFPVETTEAQRDSALGLLRSALVQKVRPQDGISRTSEDKRWIQVRLEAAMLLSNKSLQTLLNRPLGALDIRRQAAVGLSANLLFFGPAILTLYGLSHWALPEGVKVILGVGGVGVSLSAAVLTARLGNKIFDKVSFAAWNNPQLKKFILGLAKEAGYKFSETEMIKWFFNLYYEVRTDKPQLEEFDRVGEFRALLKQISAATESR